jgi:hypothetical protein
MRSIGFLFGLVTFLSWGDLANAQERNAEDLICATKIKNNPGFKRSKISPADLPIGTILSSSLHKDHFPCTVGGKWVLADGGKIPDRSKFALLVRFNLDLYAPLVSGNSILAPDLRGVFLRGKNYGRTSTEGNPDGDSTIGTQQIDDVGPHRHNAQRGYANAAGHDSGNGWQGEAGAPSGDPIVDGRRNRLETRPKNVTASFFIRVD